MTGRGLQLCLWFDSQAEAAATHYVETFRACGRPASLGPLLHYGESGPGPAGSVLTVEFELDGQRLVALNGGPHYSLTPAISLIVTCADQAELDGFWERLLDGGEVQQCGWLTDRFGVSWQVMPHNLVTLLRDPDRARGERVMRALHAMVKLDFARLERAYAGD